MSQSEESRRVEFLPLPNDLLMDELWEIISEPPPPPDVLERVERLLAEL
ncbi:hypothetical protein [Allonocardiopsis opalescens]|uniref:Uncharacterized protein n=1 Tax=Allonocardiopsis opalescens TaxID=1144618 RepID=A0A2T0Q6N3_9ACTN|nr:hypothetical protein [Allonocardiopsis opalescens]PRX99499.1 hypothetical protein CLV72_10396 [Allonocardiopsis opalescens]